MKKSFVLKAATFAVSALFASQTFAVVDLELATPVAVKYASEQTVAAAGTVLNHNAATNANQTATVKLGATFAADAKAYVRVDLTNGVFTAAAPAFSVNDNIGPATVSPAQGGTNGDNFVIFAVSPAAGKNLVGANVATFVANNVKVTAQNTVGIQYRLFESLSNAVSLATPLKNTSANFIEFSPALTFTKEAYNGTATSAVADVSATSGAYTKFTGNLTNKAVSKLTMALNTAVALQGGTDATVASVLGNTNGITLSGDFSLAANTDGTFTGAALTRVNFDGADACATAGGQIANAATVTGTTATFASTLTAANLTGTTYLCLEANGTSEIAASAYTGTLTPAAQTGFAIANQTLNVGAITRNGTVMVAPLAQIPAGWISRLVLNNIGSTDRTYTVRAVNEAGTTITLSGAAASGTLTANSTTVVDLSTTMAGGARGTLVVTVNGPEAQIEGMYQIVNGSANTISNHVLAHK